MTETSDKHARADRISVAQMLARWIAAIDSAEVPPAAIAQVKVLLLDSIGCAFAGRDESVCQKIIKVCESVGANGPCTVIGEKRAVDIGHAVLANGALVRVLDLNDYVIAAGKKGPEIGGHPSDNIAVGLAAGEAYGCSGRDILAAIVIGYEVYGRLKILMDRKGPWDGVTISGFVTAAIAGRLMGLDPDRLAHALALSGARAATPALVRRGGISAAKSIANAMVAQSAIEATLLAAAGVTGPLAILEHERGLRSIFPAGDLMATLTAPFPEHSYIMRSNVKTYPCLATGQSAVAAALKLHRDIKGAVDSVDKIEVAMADYPFVHEQQHDPGRTRPQSREAADHSFQFLIAAALTDGAFGTASFNQERWLQPSMIALMERMSMVGDSSLNDRAPGTYPCAIRLVDKAGRTHAAEVLYPPGYSRGGIDEAEVIAKFHDVAGPAIDKGRRERIAAAALSFDRAATAKDLTATLGA